MGDFSLVVENVDGTVLLRPDGELDLATAPELERALRSVDGRRAVVVDLSGLTFVDCAGLRPLRQALNERGDDMTLRVVAARPEVERVLELTGLAGDAGRYPPARRVIDLSKGTSTV